MSKIRRRHLHSGFWLNMELDPFANAGFGPLCCEHPGRAGKLRGIGISIEAKCGETFLHRSVRPWVSPRESPGESEASHGLEDPAGSGLRLPAVSGATAGNVIPSAEEKKDKERENWQANTL